MRNLVINNYPSYIQCVYLDCVELCPETMAEVHRLMEDKGIRIRIPLEELNILLEEEQMSCEDEEDEEVSYNT